MRVRSKLLSLGLAAVSLTACVTTAERSLRAYRRGEFARAQELLSRIDPSSPDYDAELAARVEEGIDYSVEYLIGQARAVAGQEGESGPSCREALALYQAALAAMPESHPLREPTLSAARELEERAQAASVEHDQVADSFKKAAFERDYARAAEALARVVGLRRCGGGSVPTPGWVLELARSAMEDGRPEVAVQLVNQADALRREAGTQAGREMAEAARLAAALRYLNRPASEPAAARPAESGKAEAAGRRREAAALGRPEPPAADAVTAARLARAREQLTQARDRFAAGDPMDAFRILDAALREVGDGPGHETLETQASDWSEERERLIADYVAQGEQALARQDTAEAYRRYLQVLALAPEHEVARDRLRKLENLRRIQGGGAEAATGK